ncbi:MAG: response regulator, partial [Moraxellaceae bacterium]
FVISIDSLATFTQGSVPSPAPRKVVNDQPVATRIYVLEDDQSIADEICVNLRHFGHIVTHFLTLAEAEAVLMHTLPDFMLVDIVFAAENREGPEAIAAIQARLGTPLPVIFMSSRTDFAAYHSAVRAGAVGYFVKPLDMLRLVDALDYHLDPSKFAPYRVLVVDDDETLAEHYKLVLSAANMRVEVAHRPEQVLNVLEDFHPEMILLDLHMPECSGPELAQIIRFNDQWLRIPITYLSGETDVDQRVKAMGQAGDDFLDKPISDRELVAAVSIRAARSRQLSDAIDRDSLTGLLKHARIKEQLELELGRAIRTDKAMSVVMMDLDHFKSVNDTYGHSVGDKVIKAIAHLLRQRLRKTDAIGRYGGEEFVAVLPGCDAIEAKRLMEDVRKRFKEIGFTSNGKTFEVTLSGGIATFEPASKKQAEAVLQAADEALYYAKNNGRDQIHVA